MVSGWAANRIRAPADDDNDPGVVLVDEAEHEEFVQEAWLPPIEDRVREARNYVKKVPGIVGARRFKTLTPGAAHSYVAIYEVDSDDVQGVMDAIGKAAANGALPLSDALQLNPPPGMTLCEEI